MSNLLTLLKINIKANIKNDLRIVSSDKIKKSSMVKKISMFVLTIIILGYLMFAVGLYSYLMAKPLSQMNLTYIVIALFYIIAVFVSFMSSINKSQGMLFMSRDNDMLFAMPIKKHIILTVRIIRLILFEYIWIAIIMLPTLAVYAYFESPGALFYIISFIMLTLLPVIPMVIGCIFGYIIQTISSYFRSKNMIQIILMIALTIGIFTFSFSLQKIIPKIIANAKDIFEMLSKIYYPLGIYISNIFKLNIFNISIYIFINIVVFAAFIYIFSIKYFKIISKLGETHALSNYKMKTLNSSSVFKSLIVKELKKYFSSAIYVMNTMFGPVIFLISSIYVGYKGEQGLITMLSQGSNGIPTSAITSMSSYIPIVVIMFAMFCVITSSITASSISIEGKTFWFLKSMPISTNKILLSKIVTNIIIILPTILIGAVIYIIKLKFTMFYATVLIATCVILMLFTAVSGLLMNLMFPNMNAANDTVVVKQSISSIISMLGGIVIIFIPLIIFNLFKLTNTNRYMVICLCIFALLDILLMKIVLQYGKKRIIEIN